MPAGPHFVTQPRYCENIPNIYYNHQQNTRRSDQIETIKTIMQTTRLVSHGRFTNVAQAAIFKEIFDQVRKRFRPGIVLFLNQTSQRLTLYLLSSHKDNIFRR